MSDFRLSGLGSGLDTRALVTQLMAIERRPITLMEKTQSLSRGKIDLYRQINTQLVALQRQAQKVMGLAFNGAVAARATALDPSKLSATVDASAVSGSYTVDVQALARKQITGGGAFTIPTASWSVSDPSKYTATLGPSALSGVYAIDILSLAQSQKTGAGTFNAPLLSATPSNGNIAGATAGSTAAFGTNAYALTNIQHFTPEITRGMDATTVGIATNKTGVLTLTKADGTFVDINLTTAETDRASILNKIKAQSDAFGITTTLNGANQLVFTGSDGGNFTITGTRRTLDALGLQATSASTAIVTAGRTTTTQAAALARVTVNGVLKTASGYKDDFTAADLGITGVGFSIAPGAINGSASTLTVTNTAGTLRITDVGAGTSKDIAITSGMTNTQVRDAINAAGSGMTAALDGSNNLVLTGASGKVFTVADAGGGSALAASLGIDSASKTFQAAQQASLTVNGGPAIMSDTDTFTSPITGVDINALQTGPATLTVVNNTGTIRITKDSDGTFQDIAIASGATANNVASAINAAGTGMVASVNAGKLTLTAGVAGESFTVGDAGGGDAFAATLGIDSATKTTQTGQLGSIAIDGGAPITSTSNTFVNPITGVTINALAVGTTTLDVQAGTNVTEQDAAEKKATLDGIRELVNQFNDVLGYLKSNSAYNTTTKKAGALMGDSLASDLRTGLTRMFTEVVDSDDVNGFRTAFSVGIQLQRDGTIKLDEAKLKEALETDADAIKTLFTHEDGLTFNDANGFAVKTNAFGQTGLIGDGIANRLNGFIDSMISSASAYSGTDGNGIRSRGRLLSRVSANEALIDDLDKRIEAYKRRLEQREGTLLAKFNAMEKVVAMMRNQGSYLSSQLTSLYSLNGRNQQ